MGWRTILQTGKVLTNVSLFIETAMKEFQLVARQHSVTIKNKFSKYIIDLK